MKHVDTIDTNFMNNDNNRTKEEKKYVIKSLIKNKTMNEKSPKNLIKNFKLQMNKFNENELFSSLKKNSIFTFEKSKYNIMNDEILEEREKNKTMSSGSKDDINIHIGSFNSPKKFEIKDKRKNETKSPFDLSNIVIEPKS